MAYSNAIAPSAGWPAVPTPADGDDMDGTNETTVQQALADRDELLYTRLMPLTLNLPLFACPTNDNAEWDYNSAAADCGWESQTTNVNEFLDFWFTDLPDGCVIVDINVGVKGTSGGYAGTPAVKNNISFLRKNSADGVLTLSHGGTDPNSHPNMTVFRNIVSSPGVTVDRATTTYGVRIAHESGANAQAGVQVQNIQVVITRPTS